MLSSDHRLPRASFPHVFKGGQGGRTELFLARWRLTGLQLPARVGVVVPVKTARLATTRNRLKRRFRAVLREFLPLLPVGLEIVFLPQNSVGRVVFAQLHQEVEAFFRRQRWLGKGGPHS